MNSFFVNIGPNLANSILQSHDINATDYIQCPNVNRFAFHPVTENEVSSLFGNLKTNKASVDVPNRLIKLVSVSLAVPFTKIYNESLMTGIVPDCFKVAQVTPIFKSGDPTDPGNYRPISMLPSFSKILERLVYNQLISFFYYYLNIFILCVDFKSQRLIKEDYTVYNLKNYIGVRRTDK